MASSHHNSSTPVLLLGTFFNTISCFSDQIAYLPNALQLLQIKDLRVGQWKEPYIGLTQENSVQDYLPYILIPNSLCELFLAYPKWPCVLHVIWHHPSRTFYILPYVMWLVTVSFDVTCCVTALSCHSNPNPSPKNRIEENKLKRE